ncbi:MAG: PorP/SprF family type IX secretion system membrane protein [Paludibacteraceae bacterium]|nr:PorP/SprF family type IX secretion system membrane protein [Paludibacteraceae bacterium]
MQHATHLKIFGCICALFLGSVTAVAQDYTFSNHNIVPFSLNPAVVGGAYAVRFGLNYRLQWPMLSNHYHTVRASYDQNIYKRMCSVGVAYTYDNMADGAFQTHEIDAIYGHTIRLTRDQKHFLRLGVQATVFANYADYNKMIFGDQYLLSTGTILPETVEYFESDHRTVFDFSTGVNYLWEGILNVGFAVYHLAEPDYGFVEGAQKLPRRFVGTVHYTQDLKKSRGLMSKVHSDSYFFANAWYQHQGDFDLAYLGAGVCFQPVILGASLRSDFTQVTTISFTAGAYYKGLQIYYIFDLYTQTKKNGSWSNEISLIYTIPTKKKDLCPVVYW